MFDSDQIGRLNAPLAADNVKKRKGSGSQQLSYLASPYVIQTANEIFGYGNWGTEIQHMQQVDKTTYEKTYNDNIREMISISYVCQLKLTVRSIDWDVSYEDAGFGNGVASNNAVGIASCIELASKEAVTDALKRCMRYFGNQFGLSLYETDDKPMFAYQIEAQSPVSDDELFQLRELYKDREIDDSWVIEALKAEPMGKEQFAFSSLDEMSKAWFTHAMQVVTRYKQNEIRAAQLADFLDKKIYLMENAGSMEMLKVSFAEAWREAGNYGTKEQQAKVQDVYETKRKEIEGETV